MLSRRHVFLMRSETSGLHSIFRVTLFGDEVISEMRIRKRIESAGMFLKRCSTVRYVIFWASIFDFRMWSKLKGSYTWPTVILKPWKQNYEII
jgi:hypothetical protein